jgi:2-hydroxychromene-2-carboxylate isomerase
VDAPTFYYDLSSPTAVRTSTSSRAAPTSAVCRRSPTPRGGRCRSRAGIGSPHVKELLRSETAAAQARGVTGVTGVPTVAVSDRLFWGDDRLGDAAAAAA